MKNCKINNISSCTGCSACANICPNGAITMQENKEGFLYPIIDENLCSGCKKCEQICPELNKIKLNPKINNTYAFIAQDKYKNNSSSGGAFALLAEKILLEGGYVAGCTLDNNFEAQHIIISDINDLYKLKGSKYIQSKIGNCYKETKKLLDENKKVLFSATPCQIAGLYSYLNKDYDNLLTIDVLCHGVPSIKVFRKYLQGFDDNIKEINFRYKTQSPYPMQPFIKIAADDKDYIEPFSHNLFIQLFLENMINRQSCSTCHYAKDERTGDITLGDFWKTEEIDYKLNSYSGISMVSFNNEKGQEYFEYFKNNSDTFIELPKENALKGNPVLYEPYKAHKNRKTFFDNLDNLTLEQNKKLCLDEKYDVGIMNLWYSHNFGAILTAYALQEFISSLGYSVKVINNFSEYFAQYKEYYNDIADKYLNITDLCQDEKDFKNLNKYFDTFITGSDQVFRIEYFADNFERFFLDFANFDKKKIAFSASFGQDYINAAEEYINCAKDLIKQFDYVSTRELSGIDICKKYFDCKAEFMIDPVFIAEQQVYEKLALNSKKDFSSKIVAYVLDENDEYKEPYDKFSDKEIYRLKIDNDTIEDFIKAFRQADYIITDSYHGVCFAIIYNKPFICIANKFRGYSRFESLGEIFNIKNHIFDNIQEAISNINNLDNINYEQIHSEIIKYRNYIKDKLKEIIDNPKNFNPEIIYKSLQNLKDKNKVLEDEVRTLKEKESFLERYISKLDVYAKNLENKISKLDKVRKTILLLRGVLS